MMNNGELALITGSATFGLTAWKTCSSSPRARHRLSQALRLLAAILPEEFGAAAAFQR